MEPRIVTVSPSRARVNISIRHRSGAYRIYTRASWSPSGRRLFWVLADLVARAGWTAEPYVTLCGTRYTEPAPLVDLPFPADPRDPSPAEIDWKRAQARTIEEEV
jgi:hypothetical protein